jgi:tight adherence protein B
MDFETLMLAAPVTGAVGVLAFAFATGSLAGRRSARARLHAFVGGTTAAADARPHRTNRSLGANARRSGPRSPAWLAGREMPLLAMVVVPGLALVLSGQIILAIAAAFQVVVFAMLWGHNLVAARAALLDEQTLPTVLRLASSLRSGSSLMQAMEAVAENGPTPTREVFAAAVREVGMGAALDDALDNLARKIGTEDYAILAQVLNVQRRIGGNLAQVLDQIAATIRERIALRQEVATLTAQQRLSTWILVLLPYAVLGLFLVLDRAFLAPLVTTVPGRVVLLLAAIWQAAGTWALRWAGKIPV